MIRVTVELVTHGDESRKRELAKLEIANDGTGSQLVGNYKAILAAEYGSRSGKLKNFNRQTQSVWTLIGGFLKLFGHTKHSPKLMEKD